MVVLVCGGRGFKDKELLFRVLDDLPGPIDCVIHGAATGADTFAGKWCARRGVTEIRCPANWTAHGKAAGPIRNQHMLEKKPDLVVAFPGGNGTADMVRRAKKSGIEVMEVA